MRNKDFVVLILSHGRADRVYTYNKLSNRIYCTNSENRKAIDLANQFFILLERI